MKTYQILCDDCTGHGISNLHIDIPCNTCKGKGVIMASKQEMLVQAALMCLNELIQYCEHLETLPNKCSYTKPPSPFYENKTLRDGILFYSAGWGWRLRKEWRPAIKERYEDSTNEQA